MKRVYIIGAGINRVIKTNYNPSYSPPLIDDFFQIALAIKNKKFQLEKHYQTELKPVFDYIQKYWNKDKFNLMQDKFDLEECFTLLEFHRRETSNQVTKDPVLNYENILFKLQSFFTDVIFEFNPLAISNETFEAFSKLLLDEKEESPTIITFNYDIFLELSLQRILINEKLEQHDKILHSYNIQFDQTITNEDGIDEFIKTRKFDTKRNSNFPSILKLHGSVNWFRFVPITPYDVLEEENIKNQYDYNYKNKILVKTINSSTHYEPPIIDRLYLDPIIVTPILNKEGLLLNQVETNSSEVNQKIFPHLWKLAKKKLLDCDELIIIGYSFPTADFLTKKLFLESFSDSRTKRLGKLVIVNPDTSLVQKIKHLCHYDREVIVCKDLTEFIEYNRSMTPS